MDRRSFLRDIVLIVSVFLLSYSFGVAFAQSDQASAKATAAAAELVALPILSASISGPASVDTGWRVIFQKRIKTANAKDLFISPSLECGLVTKTGVKSSGGSTDTAEANAQLRVRVVIDPETPAASLGDLGTSGTFALPSRGLNLVAEAGKVSVGEGVAYCWRIQKLSAKLQGILSCPAGAVIPTECTLTDEEIEFLLKTLDASTFNFIAPDVSSGNHIVEVQAKATASVTTSSTGTVNEVADAKALAGAGSVTIEVVRMIRGEEVSF